MPVPPESTQPVVHSSHTLAVWATVLGSIGTFLAGLFPFLQWVKKWRADRIAKRPRLVTHIDLEIVKTQHAEQIQSLKSEFRAANDELGRVVKTAALESSDAREEMRVLAKDMKSSQEVNAKEIRESLFAFKLGIDASLGQVHEKANDANIKVADLAGEMRGINGRIESLEKKAG